jgi:prevent-host-death family protein
MEGLVMQITNISDAKASLSKLIEQVLQGKEVIIGKAGKPVAKLVPYEQDTSPRTLGAGQWKGKIQMADDFDELPDELLSLFIEEAEDDEPLA